MWVRTARCGERQHPLRLREERGESERARESEGPAGCGGAWGTRAEASGEGEGGGKERGGGGLSIPDNVPEGGLEISKQYRFIYYGAPGALRFHNPTRPRRESGIQSGEIGDGLPMNR